MESLLDYRSIFACTCVATGSAALAMHFVRRAHRRDAAVRYWSFGFLSWFGACVVFALREHLPPWFWMFAGNFFGGLASSLVYVGTARFLGKPVRRDVLWVTHVACCIGLAYGVTQVAPDWRVLSYDSWITVMCLLMVRDLWSSAHGPHRATYLFMVAVWLSMVVVSNVRMVLILTGDAQTVAGAVGPNIGWPLLIWLLISLANVILSCTGFLLMVSLRLQEKNNWARLEEIFHEALALPATRRPAFLREVCDGDEVLLAELESLVRAAESPSAELDAVGIGVRGEVALGPSSLIAGTTLGDYAVGETIGHGGMGEVYVASRRGTEQEPVAIKVLKRDAAQHAGRFAAEYRIVSGLDHPGIARFLDSGATPDGRPFMVMEYVAGRTLTAYCQEQRLSLRQLLQLFTQVCEAVSYAHAHLVVHRDLKPGNILVTAEGRIKLLDFGVAKMLKPVLSLQANATVTMAVPVTVEYAAPEQLQGETISIATDVYALGMLLYELLAGELPWSLKELPISVGLHKILTETPRPVSIAAQERRHSPVLPRLLRGHLDAVVARALAKDPRDRQPSVEALRMEIEAYLRGDTASVGPGPLARLLARLHVRRG